jgi:mRNA interferase MazF
VIFPRDDELALLVVVPHTTAIWGNRWELAIPKPFLKQGVFHLQQIQPISLARFDLMLGNLSESELAKVRHQLAELFHL